MKLARTLVLMTSAALLAACGGGSTVSKPSDSGRTPEAVKAVKPSLEFGDVCGLFSADDVGDAVGMTLSAGTQSISTRGIDCRYTSDNQAGLTVTLIADGAPDTSVASERKRAKSSGFSSRKVDGLGSDAVVIGYPAVGERVYANGTLEIDARTWAISFQRRKSSDDTDDAAKDQAAKLLEVVAAGTPKAPTVSVADIAKSPHNACAVGLDEMKGIFEQPFESSWGWGDDLTYCQWQSSKADAVSAFVTHPTDSQSNATEDFTELKKAATTVGEGALPVVLFDVPGVGDKAFVTWIDQGAKDEDYGDLRGAFERDGEVTSFSLDGPGPAVAGREMRDRFVEFMKAQAKATS